MHFSVQFVLCFKIVYSYAKGFKELRPFHCVFGYLQVEFKELQPLHSGFVYWWIEFKELLPPFFIVFWPLIVFLTSFDPPFSQCFHLSLCFWLVYLLCFLQSSNTSTIPITQPLPCHYVLYLIPVCSPRLYSSSDSEPKSPITKAWFESPKSNVNPIEAIKS